MKKQPSLFVCLLLDAIGMSSFFIPIIGESFDIIWAPFAALIYIYLFGFRNGWQGALFTFVEEFAPGTDFIPTFTISWLYMNAVSDKSKVA